MIDLVYKRDEQPGHGVSFWKKMDRDYTKLSGSATLVEGPPCSVTLVEGPPRSFTISEFLLANFKYNILQS